ncbi:hypothetical protein [Streptomyces aurantiogriseus]|uniref:Uncharacterized protein n=1 Tax=Streptomyces aurantiogriseus TaxID=66870 RepID=A0A918C3B7_9ACTN|nr:hypothetical protein [Streptomyces aurantiogriseus]GGR02607.1 hypothetical protein GCM10010251_18010 [Streptomyces aurantiogriseus]
MTAAPSMETVPERQSAARRSVLLAPITVTPSKPLTPSHLKGLLWTDVMYRATRHLADVTYRYSHTTYHPTEQTLGFWEFLDRTHGDAGYSALTEDEIGELYMAFRTADRTASARALRPYAEAAERGWVHPASTRILQLWSEHYAGLGLHDPGLLHHQPPGLGLDEVLDRLDRLGMCLDQRRDGGPVYLDLTRCGLPLRRLVTADGRPNYLACALRELVALAVGFDEVVLLYDRELDPDYQLLARVLGALGPHVRRVPLSRVPVDGHIRSARHGGWRDHQARTLLAAARERYAPPAVRLGVRLYFVATLGPGEHESYRPDLLDQCFRRAERLIADGQEPPDVPLAERLARHRKDHVYVDPYRVTAQLLGRRRTPPARDLLAGVFL